MVYESLHNIFFLNQFPRKDSLNIYTYAKRIQQYEVIFVISSILYSLYHAIHSHCEKWTSCRGSGKLCWKYGKGEEGGWSRDTAWLWTEKLSFLVIWLVRDYSKTYQWLRRNAIETQLILSQNSCFFLENFTILCCHLAQ